MEYSSAEMTCILKINTQCEGCKVKVMQVLRNIRGVYNVTIDGEQGTVKVTGRVNPKTLLSVLEKYSKHAEVKFVKFDGEVMDRRDPYYYGEGHGYNTPYGAGGPMECSSYPSLPFPPQHQCFQPCVAPPPPPMPLPPLPCHPPLAPLLFPPFGPPPPVWPPATRPYGPPPLAPEWPPPPPPPGAPREETSNRNKQNDCIVM